MNQAISKGDDPPGIGDPLGELGGDLEQTAESFADDLELPLDSGPQERVVSVVVERLPDRNVSISPQASAMSKRYFRASGRFKEQDPAGLDGIAEVGIPDGAGLDQVDRDPEERLEVLL